VPLRRQEMDPLSILASVTGLLMAAGTVASTLSRIRSSVSNARQSIDQVVSEVDDLRTSLSAMSMFLIGLDSVPRRRVALIQVDQLVATLTEAVLTFSELEALVSPFATKSDISMTERMKWAWKEDKVLPILQRLQRHKSSFSMMLNIVQW
jgi:signal transduction histidine kinase